MRLAFTALLALHGLIHLLGVAEAFGLADLPLAPISRPMGALWGVAAILMLASAVAVNVAPRGWWMLGLGAVVLSQAVIVGSWTDAAWGTLPNVVLLAAALLTAAAEGPWGLRAAYLRAVDRAHGPAPARVLTEADLATLPAPVADYLRGAGVVGQPAVRDVYVRMSGRIRGGPTEPWMPFEAEQHNVFGPNPLRLFWMEATRGGVPMHVYHQFADGQASMRVRVLGAVPVVDASGPELTRAETVTLLNDMCVLAPGTLVDPEFTWDGAHVRWRGVEAELRFDGDRLVDFHSADRSRTVGDKQVPTPWSTPLDRVGRFGPLRLAAHGEARWHEPGGEYAYIEMEMTEIRTNVLGGDHSVGGELARSSGKRSRSPSVPPSPMDSVSPAT